MQIEAYEGMIGKLAYKFRNITRLDPALSIDDLKSEGNVAFCEALQEEIPSNVQFSTIVYNKIQQKLINLYKKSTHYLKSFEEGDFEEVLITAQDGIKKFEERLYELPEDLRMIAESIIEAPKTLTNGKFGFTKRGLIKYLTKEKAWKYKKASKTVEELYKVI